MLCPACGANVGETVRLCEACVQAKAAREGKSKSGASDTGEFEGRRSGDADFDNYKKTNLNNKEYPFANLGIRFLALLLDQAILYIIFLLFYSLGLNILDLENSVSPNLVTRIGLFLAIIAVSILGFLYYTFFESSKFQATPGKLFFGLAVTDLNYNLISFKKACIRYLSRQIYKLFLIIGGLLIIIFAVVGLLPGPIKYLSLILLIIGAIMVLIDCPLAFVTEKKQALHDMLSSCVVIEKEGIMPFRIVGGILLIILLWFTLNFTAGELKKLVQNLDSNEVSQNFKPSSTTLDPSPLSNTQQEATIIPPPKTPPPAEEEKIEIDPSLNYITTGKLQKIFKSSLALYYPKYNRLEIGFYTTQLTTLDRDSVFKNKSIPASVNQVLPAAILKINFKQPILEISKDNIKSFFITIYRDKFGGFDFTGSDLMVEVSREGKELKLDEVVSFTGKLSDRSLLSGKFTGLEKMARPRVTFGWNLLFVTEIRVVN